MRRIKGTIIFIIIFLIILLFEFILYKNLDKLMPTYENKLYSFENEIEKEEKEFLFEIYMQVQESLEIKNDYKYINEEELNNINKNEIINNIIKKYILEYVHEYKLEPIFYISELTNTVYGDLKVIGNLYSSIILYSEDMKKIYYADINEMLRSHVQ